MNYSSTAVVNYSSNIMPYAGPSYKHAVYVPRVTHVSTKYVDLRCFVPLVAEEASFSSYVAAGFLILKKSSPPPAVCIASQ